MTEPTEASDLPTEEKPPSEEQTGAETPAPTLRGFAGMAPEWRQQNASKAGRKAHAVGLANTFTSETAREAGRLGGQTLSANREHMAAIGRKGGRNRGKGKKSIPDPPSPTTLDQPEECADVGQADGFGRRLRTRRELAGLSRSRLAAMAGVSEATIKHLEMGYEFKPQTRTILALIGVPALGLRLEDFLPELHGYAVPDAAQVDFHGWQLRLLGLTAERNAYREVARYLDQAAGRSLADLQRWISDQIAALDAKIDRLRSDTPA